MSTKNVKRYSS